MPACALCPNGHGYPPSEVSRAALARCHPDCIAAVFIDGRDGWVFVVDANTDQVQFS